MANKKEPKTETELIAMEYQEQIERNDKLREKTLKQYEELKEQKHASDLEAQKYIELGEVANAKKWKERSDDLSQEMAFTNEFLEKNFFDSLCGYEEYERQQKRIVKSYEHDVENANAHEIIKQAVTSLEALETEVKHLHSIASDNMHKLQRDIHHEVSFASSYETPKYTKIRSNWTDLDLDRSHNKYKELLWLLSETLEHAKSTLSCFESEDD